MTYTETQKSVTVSQKPKIVKELLEKYWKWTSINEVDGHSESRTHLPIEVIEESKEKDFQSNLYNTNK